MAFVLENHFELSLPRTLLVEFAKVVQGETETRGGELRASDIRGVFDRTYLEVEGPYKLERYTLEQRTLDDGSEGTRCQVSLLVSGQALSSEGEGHGPIEAFVHAVERAINERFAIDHYHEQSESSGSGASALCIVGLKDSEGGSPGGPAAAETRSRPPLKPYSPV